MLLPTWHANSARSPCTEFPLVKSHREYGLVAPDGSDGLHEEDQEHAVRRGAEEELGVRGQIVGVDGQPHCFIPSRGSAKAVKHQDGERKCLKQRRTLQQTAGLGSILDTVSKHTEDTAHSCILSVSKIHFQPTFINGICI